VFEAQAQIEFEPAIESGNEFTIEIDSSSTRNKDKSLGLALLASAAVPGMGEAYLGQPGSAKAFLLTEVGFWAAVFVAVQARDSYLQSSRNYVAEFADADADGKNEAWLNKAGDFRAYAANQHRQGPTDSYELAQILNGDRDGDYPIEATAENAWDFGSSNTPQNTANWMRYRSTLRHYRGAKVALSFAVGALALNRIASLAHTLRAYRRSSGKGLSWRVEPLLGPGETGGRLALNF
jgi:TM2 domain-containing membrane protein YozV